ncbi:MAG TPA: nicotinate (nicotinamide) nucleotide adenylyltransferase [Thermoanaerobaculia bacterium]|nr:nicotinate (nicotinamide) nucleotide adenylyltransferase [Thermoanaerobaculia bacterium]
MRIGVFGGTFDPVHDGHVKPVAAAAERFGLERVIWVPARMSPHKGAPPTDARHRVAMLALAIAGRPDWSLSFDELDREPPSYTVDTLRGLSARFLKDELWLLMGTEALAGFAKWKEPEEIVRLARIAAFHREPFVGDRLRVPDVADLRNRLEVFDGGSFRISATDLRDDLGRGGTAAGRVPEPVAEYITKHRLYRGVEG